MQRSDRKPHGDDSPDKPPRDVSGFSIGGVQVAAGRREQLELPVARLVTGNWLHLPVSVVNGKASGPVLFLSAAVHGDELNGVEIVSRVLRDLDPEILRGAVLAVPVVSMFGFLNGSRYMPDRRDLNRSFPGSAKGSLTARLANLFMTEIVRRSDYGIDLHTGSNERSNLPQIRADLDDEKTLQLAEAFGAPIMIHAKTRDGSLRAAAVKQGIPVLLYEAGEANRFDETAIAAGLTGVLRVMRTLGMLEGEVAPAQVLRSDKSRWARASRSGIFHATCELGQRVTKAQTLGTISDIFGVTQATVRSAESGLVIGKLNTPLVNRGDALVHVAIT